MLGLEVSSQFLEAISKGQAPPRNPRQNPVHRVRGGACAGLEGAEREKQPQKGLGSRQ